MTPKRAAISALTAVLVVVGLAMGAVQATTESPKALVVLCEAGEVTPQQRAPDHGGLHLAPATAGAR